MGVLVVEVPLLARQLRAVVVVDLGVGAVGALALIDAGLQLAGAYLP